MCFNKEVSLLIFIFIIITCIKLFLLKENYYGILVFFYGIIQLGEFILWTYFNKLNHSGSLFIAVILMFQPLIFAISNHYLNPSKNILLENINFSLISLYMLIYLLSIKKNLKTTIDTETKRLKWDFTTHPIILTLFYIITSCIIFYLNNDNLILVLFILTWLLSWLYSRKVTGSIWCFFASFLIVIFGILNLNEKENLLQLNKKL